MSITLGQARLERWGLLATRSLLGPVVLGWPKDVTNNVHERRVRSRMTAPLEEDFEPNMMGIVE